MKSLLLLTVALALAPLAPAAVFTNTSSADSFVRANAPGSNYGAAGADSVSGASATNGAGTVNGASDTFIRFNTGAMVTNFNALFGSNNWVISSATLNVTEQATPNNNVFNRGKGSFEIRWIANDNWTEGTGTPSAPTTTGIVYSNEPALLNIASDVSLGTFTNAGANTAQNFSLPLATAFTNDLATGGEVGFFMTAADANIGFTFSSRSFLPPNSDPFLIISAVPRPGISSATITGSDMTLSCTNAAAGSTYILLASADPTAPLTQWTPVATNAVATSAAFTLTASNALATSTQQFFTIATR
jgi:hypothetical protein